MPTKKARISINEYLAGQSRFYSGLPIEEATSSQIEREFSALTSHFNRLYEDPRSIASWRTRSFAPN